MTLMDFTADGFYYETILSNDKSRLIRSGFSTKVYHIDCINGKTYNTSTHVCEIPAPPAQQNNQTLNNQTQNTAPCSRICLTCANDSTSNNICTSCIEKFYFINGGC